MRGRVLPFVGLGAAVVLSACGGRAGAPPPPPNVVLITLDTTRADHLGSYGDASAATPRLDGLARAGVRFTRAVSPVPLTLPAHASLMTGRYPFAHGVRNNGHFALPTDLATLAERFRAAGYDTAAFVSSFVLDRQFGLARGFSVYDDTVDPPASTPSGVPALETERRADRTVTAARAWLAGRTGSGGGAAPAPYFLWVHLYDAHEPYDPPPPFAERFRASPYDGEIAFVDSQVGALVDAVGARGGRDTLVVAAGDHGESLGEHGERTHGLFVYESAVRVPLILSWPGRLDARVVSAPVRLVDVAPTILALAGLPALAPAEGRDLSPLLRDGAGASTPLPAYAETYFPEFFMGWAPLRAVDDGRWKYIDSPEPELYDLTTDPGETQNRIAESPATARALRKVLEDTVRGAERSAATALTSDAQRRLAALGYVSTPAPASAGVRPAPARMVAVFERLADGNRALAEGRPQVAVRIASDVLRTDAGNAFAQLLLGRGHLAAGDPAGAEGALTAYLARVPSSADAHHWLALARVQRGDRVRALAEEEAALAIDPGHAASIALRAGLLFSIGRPDDGLAALAAAVDARPDSAALRADYADLLADAGRLPDAEAQYRRLLQAHADDLRARAGLGILLAKAGRLDDAVAELTRVLEVDPRHEEARIERAAAYARLGRTTDARADLQRLTGPEVRPDIRRTAQRELARIGAAR